MQAESRRPEIEAQREPSDAALARSDAALEIVRDLERRLAGDPTWPSFNRRRRQLAPAPHRRRTDR